jgi:hypothetical protein
MLGDILTRKAWEVAFDEWNQQGEATFSAFMKRNQGPESKYGGAKSTTRPAGLWGYARIINLQRPGFAI